MSALKMFTVCCLVGVASCQFFMPNQGTFGYRAPVHQGPRDSVSAWGSVAPRPFSLGAGADWTNAGGHGANLAIQHTPKLGSTATLGGQLGVLNTPNNQLTTSLSHTKMFDPHMKEVGRGVSTAGVNYQHLFNNDKTTLGVQGATTFGHGMKPQHNVGVGVDHVFNDGKTSVGVQGSSAFGNGMKPQHQVGVGLTHNF